MKKFLTIIMSMMFVFVAALTAGCNNNSTENCNHTYGEWSVVEEAKSCKVEGLREHKCLLCGDIEQESFYGEHSKYSIWTVEEDSHYKVCRTCNQRFSEGAHFYSDGECICGKEEVITTLWDIPDFIVEVEEGRDVNVLFLADTQIIDSTQQRTPDRLWPSEVELYKPENMDALCFNYMRAAVEETNPDLIILVGDNVYGEFDDSGILLKKLIAEMDSYEIPWGAVNGNHDNESTKGAKWQNAQYAESEYGLFKKGDTDGNGNYTIAIKQGEEITRMFYLMDSNWARAAHLPSYNQVLHNQHGFTQNQVKWMYDKMEALESLYGKTVSSTLCFHIPTAEYMYAAAQHYAEGTSFKLGKMTTPVWNSGDFGTRTWAEGGLEEYEVPGVYNKTFLEILKKFNVDTTFCGHNHSSNTSIMYEGIRWTYVLKTGKYVNYNDGEVGGTKMSFNAMQYAVNHIYCDF